MKRLLTIVILASVLVSSLASAAAGHWTGEHCYRKNEAVSRLKRRTARAYAVKADNEGYEWGGGCWNDNGRDDTPGQPDSSGEGPDCSGLTFKAWHLRSTEGRSGFIWWSQYQNIHGPYSSYDFHSPVGSDPFYRLSSKSRASTIYMDAFAKRGHIGMIYSTVHPSSNSDYIIEAYTDSSGTDVNVRSYRYDSQYVAVRREGWTADCYPRCRSGRMLAEVIVR